MRERIARSKRIPFRVLVKYGPSKPPDCSSFITDFSNSGISIMTKKVFKPGTHLYISINNDGASYECEGVVSWAKRVPPGMERAVKCGMGIRFTHLPQGLLDFYNEKTC